MTASRSQAGTNPAARHQRTCFQKTDAIVKDPCRSSRRMRHISTAEAENKGTPHFCRAKEHAPEGAKIRTRADLALYLRTWPSTLLASSAGPVGGTASLRGAAYDASSTQRQHPIFRKLHPAIPARKPWMADAASLALQPKKRAAPWGAAEFREETSKKAAGGEPLCCAAQISPFSRKGKRHSFTIRYALTAGPPAAHP